MSFLYLQFILLEYIGIFETNYSIYQKNIEKKTSMKKKHNLLELKKNHDMKISKFMNYSINMCRICPCTTLIKSI